MCIRRHRGGKPPVRHIHDGEENAPEDICDGDVGNLHVLRERRRAEAEHRHDCHRHGREEDIRPELPPLCPGPVHDGAHHRIVESIKDPDRKHDGGHGNGRDQVGIGIEDHYKGADQAADHVLPETREAVGDDLLQT